MMAAFPVVDRSTRFQDSWLYGVVCDHIAAFLRGELKRIVAVQPPGTYKSGAWSVTIPAYAWLHAPWMRFICGSNETTLVTELSRKSRDIVESNWYRTLFNPPWKLRADQNTQQFFTNTIGGTRQGVSTNGSVIGKKAHRIIVDDIHDAKKVKSPVIRKSDKEWFYTSLFDRMIDMSESCIAVVGHRVDTDDLAGELIKAGWPVLHMPEVWQEEYRQFYPVRNKYATDPRKEGEYLRPSVGPAQEADIRSQGNQVWETKYQGAPKTREGSLFPKESVRMIRAIPVGTVAVRFWDTAATKNQSSSFTSGTCIGRTPEGRFIVINNTRGRLRPGERNELILTTAHLDQHLPGCTVNETVIEHPGGSGGVEAAEILVQKLAGFNVAIQPTAGQGSKLYRAGPFSAQWTAGNVDILDDDSKWQAGYLDRMESIHNSTEQDDMDSSSGAFNRLVNSQQSGAMPETSALSPLDDYAEGTFSRSRYQGEPD